jgi:hypothetical protein
MRHLQEFARGAERSLEFVMIRRLQLACLVVLISMGCALAHGAASGSVSGTVCDSTGVPQIGAVVQLLRPDMSVIASVYTNSSGRFTLPAVLPGRYAVKAMATSFLPSLRENIRIRSNTVVNLSLNTLYEVMQWLPAEPRSSTAPNDDWTWTLRSAANRPLLRWLEDGPLVVVSDGSGATPKLKARIMALGQEGSFGESGERISATAQDTPSDSRELLAQVDFAPGTDAGIESMLGFRQDLGYAGSVQSVAAIAVQPEVSGSGAEGLDEATIRNSEEMYLGDEFEIAAGSEEVLARFREHTPNSVVAALPFASLGWRDGDSTIRYRMATSLPDPHNAGDSEARALLPELSIHDGNLALEHGLHQQIGWERHTNSSGMVVLFYSDRIDNPVVEAMVHIASGDLNASDLRAVLLDRATGLMRMAGPEFSNVGVMAGIDHNLPGNSHIRLSYANGDALIMPAAPPDAPRPVSLTQLFAAARPRRAQMYSLSLTGTIEGTGTRWRASYRWQPEDSVTRVAPFAADAAEPWLNLHLRQPIYLPGMGSDHVELLLDIRNLLAEGYRPFMMSDGSSFVFAQDQRGIRGGLAFTF